MNVFILEDRWIEQQYLEKVIRLLADKLSISKLNITAWSSIQDLKLPAPNIHNVFLLDLEINGDKKAGFKVSQLIRQQDVLATIIFITVHDEFLPTTYNYRTEALDFIAKDQDDIVKKLQVDFQAILKKINRGPQPQLVIKTAAGYLRINATDILYLEPNPINSHQSLLHTANNQVITVTGTLNELEDQFHSLFRAHRHYLINPARVVSINLSAHTFQLKGSPYSYSFSRLRTKKLLSYLKQLNQPFQII